VKKCPRCRLISPDESEECDCGYNFISGLVNKGHNELRLKRKPIVPILFTTFLAIVLVCLFCVYNGSGFFIIYWYHFKGVIGIYILWLITIISIIITLIPTVISWIVYYRKNKSLPYKK
jgi:hypothetical protein